MDTNMGAVGSFHAPVTITGPAPSGGSPGGAADDVGPTVPGTSDRPARTTLHVTGNEGAAGFFYGSSVHVYAAGTDNARVVSGWPRRFGVVPALAACRQRRQADEDLLAAATDGSTVVLCQVLSGLGGVGKTQLAADFAERRWRDGAVDLLMWVTAGSRLAVLNAYSAAAADLTGVESADPAEGAARLLAWLAEPHGRRWLVVLDDLAAPGDMAGLWPPGTAGGRVLVTTRRRDAALAAQGRRVVDVGLFTPEEAHQYLREKLGDDSALLDEPEELAADLGHLPLALAQAAAYLLDRGLTCAGYRRRFAERRRKLADLVPETEALPDDQTATIAVTWSLSIDAADRLAPAGQARPLLRLASFLNPNGVPLTVFDAAACGAYLGGIGPQPSTEDILDGLHNLQRLSLLTIEGDVVRVHGLVQRATRDTLPPEQTRTVAQAAADALTQVWRNNYRTPREEEGLRANAEMLLEHTGDLLWQPGAHPVLFNVGASLAGQGHVHAAVTYWSGLWGTARRLLGPDHPDTLSTRHCLAGSRGLAGDHVGAVTAYHELLLDDQRVYGADHPDVLRTRANLGYWHGLAGDHDVAATILAEVLADQLRVLGPDHEVTLATRHNLARVRAESGDHPNAIAQYERLLPDQSRILGHRHRQTIATRNNLATLLAQTGACADATAGLHSTLADCLRVLGPSHPDTLSTRGELNALSHASDPAPHTALVKDCEEILGPEHPITLRARANLARSYGYAGDPKAASAAHETLVSVYRRVLGPDHPSTLAIRFNAAHWAEAARDLAGAVSAFERLLTDSARVLGPDHPQTTIVEQRLGEVHALTEILGILRQSGTDIDGMLADPLTYWNHEHARAVHDLGPDAPITRLIEMRLDQLRPDADRPRPAM
ncbi:tetratricopeptide repeat protein [Micromonospora echinospora]|uniref:tetratricopeptide repeat protein n=1 Tax=Micromonospora echinospora TaxID=1877 RepID=UPI003A844648